jgi:hypothetical protein
MQVAPQEVLANALDRAIILVVRSRLSVLGSGGGQVCMLKGQRRNSLKPGLDWTGGKGPGCVAGDVRNVEACRRFAAGDDGG